MIRHQIYKSDNFNVGLQIHQNVLYFPYNRPYYREIPMDHISQIQRLRGICKEQVEDGFREALLRANSFRQRQARLLQRRGITTYLPRFPCASPETNRSGNTGNTRLLR